MDVVLVEFELFYSVRAFSVTYANDVHCECIHAKYACSFRFLMLNL